MVWFVPNGRGGHQSMARWVDRKVSGEVGSLILFFLLKIDECGLAGVLASRQLRNHVTLTLNPTCK